MIDIELEKKANESYWNNSDAHGGLSSKKNYVLGFIAGAKEMQYENDAYWQNIITEQHKLVDECRTKIEKQNEQLKQQLENEKQLNAEIKKRLVEVEYDCEEFNHEYCDINCKGKRKETIDLYQLISDGLNETLLKQKDEENKQLKQQNEQLEKQIKDLEIQLKDVIEDNDYYQKENEKLKNHNNCKFSHEWNLANVMEESLDDLSHNSSKEDSTL